MIDMGQYNSIVETSISSEEEREKVFARCRERMKRYLAELDSEESQ